MTLYAKATAFGVVIGLVASIVGVAVLLFGGVAVTGGGGIAGVSAGLAEAILSTVLILAAAGFVAGFAWTIHKARRRTSR